jgi:hypothetical protein
MEAEMTDQTTRLPIRRALISVSDKTGILEFAPPAAPSNCCATTVLPQWKWRTTPVSRK